MRGNTVTFQANGRTCDGYLSIPEDGGGPGVIVIQERWGLIDYIKDVTDRFAAEGYVALAPDLFRGESSYDPEEALRLMNALGLDQIEKDLRGAVGFLLGHKAVSSEKVGSVGFCLGGKLSLFIACVCPEIGACVNFYGIHPGITPEIANLHGPILGLFGEDDPVVPAESVRALEASLLELGKDATFHIYPGVGHAFHHDGGPGYHEAAAKDSWAKVLAFLRKHL